MNAPVTLPDSRNLTRGMPWRVETTAPHNRRDPCPGPLRQGDVRTVSPASRSLWRSAMLPAFVPELNAPLRAKPGNPLAGGLPWNPEKWPDEVLTGGTVKPARLAQPDRGIPCMGRKKGATQTKGSA